MASILALDLGSSSLKALVMNENAEQLFSYSVPYPSAAPAPGHFEQNPSDWEVAMAKAVSAVIASGKRPDIDAVCFSGHMSGVVPIGRDGGALFPCLTLSDNRCEAECRELSTEYSGRIAENTGNLVITAFTLPKLLWMKKNHPEVLGKTWRLLYPKDYLRFKLTGQAATEYTDAYNSLLLRSDSCDWDMDLIASVGLPADIFPEVGAPYSLAGIISKNASLQFGLKEGTPVYAGGADMACGALGMGVCSGADSAITIGTSATFFAMVPGPSPIGRGAITYHLHAIAGRTYALGSHFNGGLALNWLTGLFGAADGDYSCSAELSEKSRGLSPGGGLLTLPFLVGSGSPSFSPDDSCSVLGLDLTSDQVRIYRSMIEGIAYNMAETLEIFEKLNGKLETVSVGGGGARLSILPQIFADVFGRNMRVAVNPDASATGAAILGGYGAGIFGDIAEASRAAFKSGQTVVPDSAAHSEYLKYRELYADVHRMLLPIHKRLKELKR